MTTTPPLPKQWRDAEIARLRAAIRAVAKESHAATRGIVALHIINAEEPVAPVPEQPDGHWWLRTEVERLRARLEVNPEAPQWDGIACRDETIRILELEIKRLRAAAQGQSAQAPAQPARLPSGEYICKACDCWRTFNLDGQCIWCHWQHPQLSAAPAQPAQQKEDRPLFDPNFPREGYVSDAEWAERKRRAAQPVPSVEDLTTLDARLAAYLTHERRRNHAEAVYWHEQYKQLAIDAIATLRAALAQGGTK